MLLCIALSFVEGGISNKNGLAAAPLHPAGEIYGPVPAEKYLTGRFDPSAHPDFISVAKVGIPDRGRGVFLRKEAAGALARMLQAMKVDLPHQTFWVQSGTRNFASQKSIWESKWNGNTPVGGVRLNTVKNPLERARRILSYSSMPGTSRHHWGTDFDINELTPTYYTRGEGKQLYAWLLKNASGFGFCLPYSEGRSAGYEFEPWHWSYRPLASQFTAEWERLHKQGRLAPDMNFDGAREAVSLAPVYVTSISPDCR